nr:hypothetical protein CFP56_34651 [Quercus suber]
MLGSGPVTEIRSWINDCVDSHPSCCRLFYGRSHPAKSWFPDRLIRVDSTIDPENPGMSTMHARLAIKSRSADFSPHQSASGVAYLSLSHCWGLPPYPEKPLGGREDTVLTKSKLTGWCEEIPLHTLPPTFQEAVRVCALIGFSSDFEGFVKDRDTRVDFGFRTSFTELLGRSLLSQHNGNKTCILLQGQVKLLWSDSVDVPRSSSLNAPLFKRAWVFQERNLSRRTLAFTSTAVRFACDGYTKCEQPAWCTARLR